MALTRLFVGGILRVVCPWSSPATAAREPCDVGRNPRRGLSRTMQFGGLNRPCLAPALTPPAAERRVSYCPTSRNYLCLVQRKEVSWLSSRPPLLLPLLLLMGMFLV
eukprot:gene830-biopygen9480